jgi:hypothetical protein
MFNIKVKRIGRSRFFSLSFPYLLDLIQRIKQYENSKFEKSDNSWEVHCLDLFDIIKSYKGDKNIFFKFNSFEDRNDFIKIKDKLLEEKVDKEKNKTEEEKLDEESKKIKKLDKEVDVNRYNKFLEKYESCVDKIINNYYVISNESIVDFKTFNSIYNYEKFDFDIVENNIFRNIDENIIKVKEEVINSEKVKQMFERNLLNENNIEFIFNTKVESIEKIDDKINVFCNNERIYECDIVLDCTYNQLQLSKQKYIYELTISLIIKQKNLTQTNIKQTNIKHKNRHINIRINIRIKRHLKDVNTYEYNFSTFSIKLTAFIFFLL